MIKIRTKFGFTKQLNNNHSDRDRETETKRDRDRVRERQCVCVFIRKFWCIKVDNESITASALKIHFRIT